MSLHSYYVIANKINLWNNGRKLKINESNHDKGG